MPPQARPTTVGLTPPVPARGADPGELAAGAVGAYRQALLEGRPADAVEHLQRGAYAPAHLLILDGTRAHFERTMSQAGQTPWPLTRDKASFWLAVKYEEASATQSTRTADFYKRTLSNLAAAARLKGEAPLTAEDKTVLGSVCKTLSKATAQTPRRQAQHLTDVAIVAMAEAGEALPWSEPVLLAARLSLATALRGREVTSLQCRDLERQSQPDGRATYRLTARWTKTERNRVVEVEPHPDPLCCPVTALDAWLARHPAGGTGAGAGVGAGAGGQWLLPYIDLQSGGMRWADHMSPDQLTSRLRALARAAGLPNANAYSGHGGRSGHATARLNSGASRAEAMRSGGWRSESSFRRYDRTRNDEDVRAGIAAARALVATSPSAAGAATSGGTAAVPPLKLRPLGERPSAAPLAVGPEAGASPSSDGDESSEGESSASETDSGDDSQDSEPGGADTVQEDKDVPAEIAQAAVRKVQAITQAWCAANGVTTVYRGPYWDRHCEVKPGEKRRARQVAEVLLGAALGRK